MEALVQKLKFVGLSLFLAVLALVFALPVHAQQGEPIGEVVFVHGTVDVLRSSGVVRERAKIGDVVYANDRVETTSNGVIRVRFVDNSILKLGKNSTIKLSKYQFDADEQKRDALLHLIMGEIRLYVQSGLRRALSNYEVRAGSAVGGIRGTDIVVRVAANGLSEYYVLSGAMAVRSAEGLGKEIYLKAGNFSRIPLGQAPSLPLGFEPNFMGDVLNNMGEKPPAAIEQLMNKGAESDVTKPASAKVTQGEWAEMLGGALGISDLQGELDAQGYADILEGGESRTINAKDYTESSKYLAKEKDDTGSSESGEFMEAKSLSGTVRMNLTVPRAGKYPVKVKSKGTLLVSVGNQTIVVERPKDAEKYEWKNIGQFTLKSGENDVNVVVSRTSSIDSFQVDSRCTDPITPAGGWKTDDTLTFAEKAETMVKAMGQEGGLPLDNSYIKVLRANNVQKVRGDYKKIDVSSLGDGENASKLMKRRAIQAGTKTASVSWTINLPSDGIYSFATIAAGTSPFDWTIDACDIASHVPEFAELSPVWEEVVTRYLGKGTHTLRISVPASGTIEGVRIMKRKSSAQDYYNLLTSLGFSEGQLATAVDAQAAQDNLSNEFFQRFLRDIDSDPEEILAAAPIEDPEPEPVFLDDDEFPFGSPASPVVPGLF